MQENQAGHKLLVGMFQSSWWAYLVMFGLPIMCPNFEFPYSKSIAGMRSVGTIRNVDTIRGQSMRILRFKRRKKDHYILSYGSGHCTYVGVTRALTHVSRVVSL